MNKTLQRLALTGLVIAALACGGGDDPNRKAPDYYETVQEGQATGVTSTIHGPGETIPPMTGTNADTTSAFTINPALATASPPGTLAGSLPTQPYGGTGSPSYVPRPSTPPAPQPQPVPEHGDTTSRTMTPPPTTTTEEPPPTTTTTSEPPPTESAPPPPPPPTQTDTAPPPEKPPEQTDTTKTDTGAPPPPPPPPPAAAAW